MKCQQCGGTARMISVSAKCSDAYSEVKVECGYVPTWIGDDGDYVEFSICRHCGQMAGRWPINGVGVDRFKWGKTR
jgi:hypothetical protein